MKTQNQTNPGIRETAQENLNSAIVFEYKFELRPEGNGTKVRLTHAGLDSFPKSNPDLRKEYFVEGWKQILGKSLKEYLE